MTKDGTDPLLPANENTADLVEPPSEHEVNQAITSKMSNLIVLVGTSHSRLFDHALNLDR